MSKQQAIDELRKEALELENQSCSIKDYASNTHKIKIRRDLVDQLKHELLNEQNAAGIICP